MRDVQFVLFLAKGLIRTARDALVAVLGTGSEDTADPGEQQRRDTGR